MARATLPLRTIAIRRGHNFLEQVPPNFHRESGNSQGCHVLPAIVLNGKGNFAIENYRKAIIPGDKPLQTTAARGNLGDAMPYPL